MQQHHSKTADRNCIQQENYLAALYKRSKRDLLLTLKLYRMVEVVPADALLIHATLTATPFHYRRLLTHLYRVLHNTALYCFRSFILEQWCPCMWRHMHTKEDVVLDAWCSIQQPNIPLVAIRTATRTVVMRAATRTVVGTISTAGIAAAAETPAIA